MPADIRVCVIGALGRMGSEVLRLIHAQPGFALAAATERRGHPSLGKDPGELFGLGSTGLRLTSDLSAVLVNADCAVEFSSPSASLSNLEVVVSMEKPYVNGTTGFSEKELESFWNAAKRIPIVLAPNMSIGVNLLFTLVEIAARSLHGCDVEIIEAHHRHKKDSPSGTAKRLVEILKRVRGDMKEVHGRRGLHGERTAQELGVLSIRAGDIPGDHTVLFAGQGERIELTHRAISRLAFARGTLEAIRFVVKREPGLYSMADVLESQSQR